MGNCLELEHQQRQGSSNLDSSSKQQPQPQQNYHPHFFDGQQYQYPQQSRHNSSVRQQSQYQHHSLPSYPAARQPNLQKQNGSDYSAVQQHMIQQQNGSNYATVQQSQSQQQSRPSYSSMTTPELLQRLSKGLNDILTEINALDRNQTFEKRKREHLCRIIRETERKLCIINCDMTGNYDEGDKLHQCINDIRRLDQEVDNLKKAKDKWKQDNMNLQKLLNDARQNFATSNAIEPNKQASKSVQSQAHERENKTDNKQSNIRSEEQARHEKTLANLKEQLKKNEETANTQKTRIERIESDNRQLIESIAALEREKRALAEEKDSYVLRLSKIAGQRLVDDNPAIADLSDPNRPIKLGEMYSEIYDNEWTCALDALMNAGYDETESIFTLLLTLLNILDYCKSKSDTLLEKTEDAVNFLFKEIKDSEDKKPKKHLTITKSQRNQFLNLKNDSMHDAQSDEPISLQERWIPKKRGQKNTAQSFETVKVKKPDGVAKRLTLFRKEVAESMVPIVQKAYMAASWEDGMFIPELKPFIKKCIFLGWMMVVQAPPMALVACQEGEPLDKNMFKEYTKSGPEVDYLVWPALQLHERGPLIGKGIAQGRGKQMKQNKNNTQF